MSLSKIGTAVGLLAAAIVTLVASPGVALAYVGPGVGMSAIGSFLALIGAVFMGIVGFVWYPIKRLLRKKTKSDVQAPE
jgi:hypothetical protein